MNTFHFLFLNISCWKQTLEMSIEICKILEIISFLVIEVDSEDDSTICGDNRCWVDNKCQEKRQELQVASRLEVARLNRTDLEGIGNGCVGGG